MWLKTLTTVILIIIKLAHLIPLIRQALPRGPLGRALMIDAETNSGGTAVMNLVQDLGSGLPLLGSTDFDLVQALSVALNAINSGNTTFIDSSLTDIETSTKKPSRSTKKRRRRTKTRVHSRLQALGDRNATRRRSEDPKCDGFDNIAEDIGLLTFLFDCICQIAGLVLLLFAYLPQIYSYLSAYVIALPSVVLFLLESTISDRVEEFVDLVEVGDALFDLGFNIPSNDVINFATGFVEFLATGNLFIETFGTFPDFMALAMQKFFGLDAHEYFARYGCDDPQDRIELIDLKPKSLSGWENLVG